MEKLDNDTQQKIIEAKKAVMEAAEAYLKASVALEAIAVSIVVPPEAIIEAVDAPEELAPEIPTAEEKIYASLFPQSPVEDILGWKPGDPWLPGPTIREDATDSSRYLYVPPYVDRVIIPNNGGGPIRRMKDRKWGFSRLGVGKAFFVPGQDDVGKDLNTATRWWNLNSQMLFSLMRILPEDQFLNRTFDKDGWLVFRQA